MTPYEIFLGLFAKAEDPSSGGRQMPSHWGSRRLGIISHSSPIATQVPHAAGIAYAARYRGEDAVVGCWFGEGATSAGAWHEGLNFAGIHKLPVIFVCENNYYAISVGQPLQMAIDNVADRAAGYGFPGVVVDGNDVLASFAAMKTAVERARAGEGPTLIEAKTYRFFPHTSDDDDRSYRSREEVQEAKERDPITRFAATLTDLGVLDAAAIDAVWAETKADVDEQIDAALERCRPRSVDARAARVLRSGRRVTEKNVVTAIHDTLHEEMASDERVVVPRRGHRDRGGVFRVTQGFLDEFGDQRVIDTPLAEAGIIGIAVGMALHGLLPVAEIEFADFIHPATTRWSRRSRGCGTGPTGTSVCRWLSARRGAAGCTARCTTRSRSRPRTGTSRGSRSSSPGRRTTRPACSGRRSRTRTRSCSSSTSARTG
jgi:Pyruvate/2-oxoglutarate dehydrogenase complex, dehydrogenase (E1) component, eukaryotic type, alpha subunit